MLSKAQRIRKAREAPYFPSSMTASGTSVELDMLYGLGERKPVEKTPPPLSPLMRELYNYMEFDVLYTQRGLARALSRVSVRQQLEGLHYRYMVDKEVSDMGAVFWRKR